MKIVFRNLPKQDAVCADVLAMAERELAAFSSAVTELFGSAQAEISAEEWLRELMAIHELPASARQWRSLTVKVLARLASRVSASMSIASTRLAHAS